MRTPGNPSFLAVHDVLGRDSLGGIASIDDEFGLAHDPLVVVVGVIGDDQYAIVLPEVIERRVVICKSYLRPLPTNLKYGSL